MDLMNDDIFEADETFFGNLVLVDGLEMVVTIDPAQATAVIVDDEGSLLQISILLITLFVT